MLPYGLSFDSQTESILSTCTYKQQQLHSLKQQHDIWKVTITDRIMYVEIYKFINQNNNEHTQNQIGICVYLMPNS